jgi:SAM-dependent methyltransferase
MLATSIRKLYPQLGATAVLELDDRSPLQAIFREARSYARTYYRAHVPRGTVRADGAVCEDITQLTFADESLDLIVSSDVLEHVPDLGAAFRESARVLRSGGMHLFTVPTRVKTLQRARLEAGEVRHLIEPPEYHADPLNSAGILAFWDVGPDLPTAMTTDGLIITSIAGPVGIGDRVVWQARKHG